MTTLARERQPRIDITIGFADFFDPSQLIFGDGLPNDLIDRRGNGAAFALLKGQAQQQGGLTVQRSSKGWHTTYRQLAGPLLDHGQHVRLDEACLLGDLGLDLFELQLLQMHIEKLR